MDRRTFVRSLAVSSSALFAGCSTPISLSGGENPLMAEDIVTTTYDYNELEYGNLPQQGSPDYEVSELDDLPNVSTWSNGGLHPVSTARKLLSLLENYHSSNNIQYKNKARKVAEAFVDKSISHREGVL
jgi:hypothetical protein